jgi:hypothetical protein
MLRFKTELRGYIFLNDPIKPDTQIEAFESFKKYFADRFIHE